MPTSTSATSTTPAPSSTQPVPVLTPSVTAFNAQDGIIAVVVYEPVTSGSSEWADQLYLASSSNPRHWHLVSWPDDPSLGLRVVSVSTPAPQLIWIAACAPEKEELFRSTTGGATWSSVLDPGGIGNVGTQAVRFPSATTGSLESVAPTGGQIGLFTTSDRGRHWTTRSNPTEWPAMEDVIFQSSSVGYSGVGLPAISYAPGVGVGQFGWGIPFVTGDGGNSWKSLVLNPPRGCLAAKVVSGDASIFGAGNVVLPVLFIGTDCRQFAWYSSAGTPTDWSLVGAKNVNVELGSVEDGYVTLSSTPAVAIPSPSDWWVLDPADGRVVVLTTSDSGRTWHHYLATGLAGPVTSLLATSQKTALADVAANNAYEIEITLDGGRKWSPDTP